MNYIIYKEYELMFLDLYIFLLIQNQLYERHLIFFLIQSKNFLV